MGLNRLVGLFLAVGGVFANMSFFYLVLIGLVVALLGGFFQMHEGIFENPARLLAIAILFFIGIRKAFKREHYKGT